MAPVWTASSCGYEKQSGLKLLALQRWTTYTVNNDDALMEKCYEFLFHPKYTKIIKDTKTSHTVPQQLNNQHNVRLVLYYRRGSHVSPVFARVALRLIISAQRASFAPAGSLASASSPRRVLRTYTTPRYHGLKTSLKAVRVLSLMHSCV